MLCKYIVFLSIKKQLTYQHGVHNHINPLPYKLIKFEQKCNNEPNKSCFIWKENECYVETLAIAASQQRNGLGKRFINFAKRRTRKEGIKELTVEAFCEYDNVGFYKKCGFTKLPGRRISKGFPYFSFSMMVEKKMKKVLDVAG